MTAAIATVAPLREGFGDADDEAAWTRWLEANLSPLWRPGEWDAQRWLFTGDLNNAMTSVWTCSTSACQMAVVARSMRCKLCEDQFRSSTVTAEVFAATFKPVRGQISGAARPRCAVPGCLRERDSVGLCINHHRLWRWHLKHPLPDRPPLAAATWAATAQPQEALPECIVLGCGLEGRIRSPLCRIHYHRWTTTGGRAEPVETWAAQQLPHLSAEQFSLAPLHPTVRRELLYGLQQRDLAGKSVEPCAMRSYVRILASVTTLLSPTVAAQTANARSLASGLHHEVQLGLDRFRGIDPMDKRVWDLAAVGLVSKCRDGKRVKAGVADFTRIQPLWLQEVIWQWARLTRPTDDMLRTTLTACGHATAALAQRPGGAANAAVLRLADMDAVVAEFRLLRIADGSRLMRPGNRAALLTAWFAVLEFGRQAGLMDTVSASFTRNRSHRIAAEDLNEDEIGKAIPESVIAQLDPQIHLLGAGFTYGAMAEDDMRLMAQTIYVLLRDTGRRPGEIASLDRDCLEHLDGDYNLIWHNHKARRRRRRLTITTSVVSAVQTWQARLAQLGVPARSQALLFPSITADSGYPHLRTGDISRLIRCWLAVIDVLHSELPGLDGTPIPFDRALIFPYAFRHSYAQRHADAGTDPDVLRALMDHTDLTTTQRYYRVSQQRKRDAVKKMLPHVVDRFGAPARMASAVAYQARSVAVPFGNCVEPQNVLAGGKGCRIRFQCAGCGFYRPDPSYLPAIDAHIHALKADRETATAMDADVWVTRNLTDQVAAFGDVADIMRQRLEGLPDDERAAITEAAAVLRKARASEGRTVLPLTVLATTPSGSPQ